MDVLNYEVREVCLSLVFQGLEVPGNKCVRQCTRSDGKVFTSERKIKCDCSGENCSYKIAVKGSWIAWDSTKANGKSILSGKINFCSFIPEQNFESPTRDWQKLALWQFFQSFRVIFPKQWNRNQLFELNVSKQWNKNHLFKICLLKHKNQDF